ncbi:MAG TPA: serine/threonine-protein kinase [Polyangiaceae bacterium]|nr:serine/threonine-protein kinase [Polyangiaceae bacterium]
MTNERSVTAGRIIADKYCLLFELGRGGMGSVWVADHLALRSRVAVKVIDPVFALNPKAQRRFEQEAQAAASLRSPHVVQVLDFGVDQGSPYLVMELLEGESLASRLETRGPLPPNQVWSVISQVARAMTRAHAQGFVHRDLKPDNVFLVEDGEEPVVKVLDFGVAKALTEPQLGLTETGMLLGTPLYASPEQAECKAVDSRSDLWSLGVMTFECLTGRQPFKAASLPKLLSAICYDPIPVPSRSARVPVGFDNWFARAVNRDRERRFQSAKELSEELRPLLGPDAKVDWIGPTEEEDVTVIDREGALRFHTYPRGDDERRSEARIPSSIPAGINRRRDIHHTALIYNASRSGALLLTRHPCEIRQELLLTLHIESAERGEEVPARVVRVRPHPDEVWQFEVGVRFVTPLSDELVARLEARAKPKRPD